MHLILAICVNKVFVVLTTALLFIWSTIHNPVYYHIIDYPVVNIIHTQAGYTIHYRAINASM